MTLYGATLPIRLGAQIDKAIVVLRVLDYLVSSVPQRFLYTSLLPTPGPFIG